MNPRLRRILAPPAVMAICFGLLAALSLILRGILSIPLLGGPELSLWGAIVSATFAISIVAEAVSSSFRFKYFLLGSLGPAVFFFCALIGYRLRTGLYPHPDSVTVWVCVLISIVGGTAVHLSAKRKTGPPPNTSLERTREG